MGEAAPRQELQRSEVVSALKEYGYSVGSEGKRIYDAWIDQERAKVSSPFGNMAFSAEEGELRMEAAVSQPTLYEYAANAFESAASEARELAFGLETRGFIHTSDRSTCMLLKTRAAEWERKAMECRSKMPVA